MLWRIPFKGKSLSESRIFASTKPQYDDRLVIELQVQYVKFPSSEHIQRFLIKGYKIFYWSANHFSVFCFPFARVWKKQLHFIFYQSNISKKCQICRYFENNPVNHFAWQQNILRSKWKSKWFLIRGFREFERKDLKTTALKEVHALIQGLLKF